MVAPQLKRRGLVTPKKGQSVVSLLDSNYPWSAKPVGGVKPEKKGSSVKPPSPVSSQEMVSDLLTLRSLLGEGGVVAPQKMPINPIDQKYPWTNMTPRDVYNKRAMDLARQVAVSKQMRDEILARAERENADEAQMLLSPFMQSEAFLADTPSMVAPPSFPVPPERERNPQMGGLAGLGGALAGLMVPEAAGEIATGQKKQAEGMADVDFQNAVAKWDATLRNMTVRYEAEKEHEDKVRQVNQFNAGVKNANMAHKLNATTLYAQAKGDQRRTTALEDALKRESGQAGDIAAMAKQSELEQKYVDEVAGAYKSMMSMARGGNTDAIGLVGKMLGQIGSNQRQGKQLEGVATQAKAGQDAALDRTKIMAGAISTRQGASQQFTLNRDVTAEDRRIAAERRAETRRVEKENRDRRTKEIVQRNKAALADLEEAREEAKADYADAKKRRLDMDDRIDSFVGPAGATPEQVKKKRLKLEETRANQADKERKAAMLYNQAKAAYEKRKKELEAGVKSGPSTSKPVPTSGKTKSGATWVPVP